MTCPECRSETLPGAAFCGYCGTPQGASVSQFPRTPGDQYVACAGPGQHGPPPSAPPREFRLDLRRLSRTDQAVGGASLVVLLSLFLPFPALLAGPTLTCAAYAARWRASSAGVRPESRPHSLVRWAWSA